MTLEEHTAAIESAIQAAADDGFELDNGQGTPIHELNLNIVMDGDFVNWEEISLPPVTYY